MFNSSIWANWSAFGRPLDPGIMWSAYNKLFPVDVDGMPEDADSVVMRPCTSPPPHGGSPRLNGAPPSKKLKVQEDDRIQEYLQRTDTAVIYPEPPDHTPTDNAIEEPKIPSEYLLKCPHCEQVFSGQQAIHELSEHLSANHKDANPSTTPDTSKYNCSKCNESFSTKENRKKNTAFHTATNGQGSSTVNSSTDENDPLRKFKCIECGKAFKFKHHLKEHIRIHSGEKPFACLNCGKRFSHSGSYSSHNTSKKCLVVNLKVRKVNSRSSRGRGCQQHHQNNSFRPIIPKFNSSSGGELVPAGYMPPSSFSGRPQQPFLPITFHPLLASRPHYPHLPLSTFPEVTQLLQQRRYESESEQHISSHFANNSDKVKELSPSSSPKPQGEMNAVKKILEIVDATVNKQQQSPTRHRNGLLSELLSSAPHPIVKTPPPVLGSSTDARCRFCSKFFDNQMNLHHHQRYLCPLGIRTKSPEENDGDSCEESVPSPSSSVLGMDTVLRLKAHLQMNPRPKKQDMIRLARELNCSARAVQEWFAMKTKDFSSSNGTQSSSSIAHPFSHCNGFLSHPFNNGAIASCPPSMLPFCHSARQEDDQPLDLSVKNGSTEDQQGRTDHGDLCSSPSHNDNDESEVLNLSQRSSRTPPKISSPYSPNNNNSRNYPSLEDATNNNLHSSLLYKYMQMGNTHHQREKSPLAIMPSSPDRSPSQTDRPHSMSSPVAASYAENSISPSGTTESYCHPDEPSEGNPYSPSAAKKPRLWNQIVGDEDTLEDSFGPEEGSSAGCGKMRKSWKLHKVESEEGMYACDQCDKMFSKQSSLARHKYEHSGLRPHKCELCGKAFKHKHHLTEHKRLHSGEKPFQCKKCHKRFSHSGSYSQHMNHRFSYCKPYHE